MSRSPNPVPICLEIGNKRVFAAALDWPGWCRSGRSVETAVQALFDYGPRYSHAVRSARLGFQEATDLSGFEVVERLRGDTTTDFGAPGKAPAADAKPVTDADLSRLQALLKACWRAFDLAVAAAKGKELRKGPRGGGRDLEAIIAHVVGGESGYLASLGGKLKLGDDPRTDLRCARQAVLEGLEIAAHGGFPARGPRGGVRWTPRYFVRRSAWHVLDHAWEIEDRIRGAASHGAPRA
jgi:hypothetical protein